MQRDRPRLNYAFAKDHGLVLMELGERARLGVRGEPKAAAILEARRALARPLDIEPLTPAEFDRQLSESYAADSIASDDLDSEMGEDGLASLIDGMPRTADLLDTNDDAPVIRLINALMAQAIRSNASDIHIEPFEDRLSVRIRIDGVLREVASLPARIARHLVSRVKVMARLDIAESRVPHDGRMSLALGGRSVDVRVSTLPSQYGERVVLRLLDKERALLDLSALGMPPGVEARFRAALAEPNGILLVTGPTGSGKTTTLYAGLSHLNDHERNILTIEDPVEYALEGVGQTQVNAKVGMTFAAGLRAILRQDPDVVMVGEIRDRETVEIAIQASLTGHLVLSTVHTNSAAGAITRLRDMGIEPFLLASTIRAVISQRLVRRLCEHCKAPKEVGSMEQALLGLNSGDTTLLYQPAGCEACGMTGYCGRSGLFELVAVDDRLRQIIHRDANEDEIAAAALSDGDNLLANARNEVLAGRTSLAEMIRVCPPREHDDAGL